MFRFFFTLFILFFYLSGINAQHLEWILKPVIEQDKFYYFPNMNEEFIIVENKDGRQGVLRKNGSYLYEADRFDKVGVMGGNGIMYGMNKNEKTVVFNIKGKVISGDYDYLNSYHHTNIILAVKDNLYGLIDTSGYVIRKPQYKYLTQIKRGLYKGEFPDGKVEMIEVNETDGLTESQRSGKEKKMRTLIKDRIVFYGRKVKGSSLKLFGCTDLNGDTIFQADKYYGIVNLEKHGIILTYNIENKKRGAIDKNGNVVIPFKYNYINKTVYKDKYLLANIGKMFYIIDVRGNVRASYEADDMYSMDEYPYFRAVKNKKYTLLDLDFKPVLNRSFDRITDLYKPDWSIILNNKKKGFFSAKTGVYTEPQFKKLTVPLIYDVFGVTYGKKYGLFDVHKGEFISDTLYTSTKVAGKYFIATIENQDSVLENNKYKKIKFKNYFLLDSSASVIYGPVKNKIKRIAKDIFAIRKNKDTLIVQNFRNGKVRYYDKRKIKFLSDNVSKIDDDLYCFTDEILDENHETFEYLSSVMEHLRIFKKNGKYGLIHNKKVVNISEFDQIGKIDKTMINVKMNNKWGILRNPFYN